MLYLICSITELPAYLSFYPPINQSNHMVISFIGSVIYHKVILSASITKVKKYNFSNNIAHSPYVFSPWGFFFSHKWGVLKTLAHFPLSVLFFFLVCLYISQNEERISQKICAYNFVVGFLVLSLTYIRIS